MEGEDMTAKQYLSRARHLDGEINDKLLQRESIYESLTKITQSYDSDGAQATKDPHKYDRLAEFNNLIDKLIDEYVGTLVDITETISKIPDERQRRVLTLYYTVKDKTTNKPLSWEQVAVELHYSWKQTRRIHARALVAVEEIIGETCP